MEREDGKEGDGKGKRGRGGKTGGREGRLTPIPGSAPESLTLMLRIPEEML